MSTTQHSFPSVAKKPLVDVYIARLPEATPSSPVLCASRRAEIEGTANERVRREKHYVWRLLCYGLEKSLGLNEAALCFSKEKSGAWSVAEAAFSLSHSNGLLAVAVSHTPVGIDIERVCPHKDKALAARLLTASERAVLENLPPSERNAFLLTCFTGKEAVFKAANGALRLSEIDTLTASLVTDTLFTDGNAYIWSVATDTPHAVRVFTDIDLLP